MIYVRFRGARRPESSECVRYEDPEHPSNEGLLSLCAQAHREAESRGLQDQELTAFVAHYVGTQGYAGQAHVGGIAKLPEQQVPELCDILTLEEFESAKAEINASNKTYRQRKFDEVQRLNDPDRRAHPDHEGLGWRTRAWVLSHTELEHHRPYRLTDDAVFYPRARQHEVKTGKTLQLVDVFHRGTSDIEEALVVGADLVDLLVDRLAIKGYGSAHVVQVVSTTVPAFTDGQEFLVAIFDGIVTNSAVLVTPDEFGDWQAHPQAGLVARHIREGLSAFLPTTAFAHFWNAMERLAEEHARMKGLKRTARCETCGAERQIGWNTKLGMQAMYRAAGRDPEAFERDRSTRGSVQHGARMPTVAFLNSLLQDLKQLQVSAIGAFARTYQISPATSTYVAAGWPITVLACVVHGQEVTTRLARATQTFGAAPLPPSLCGEQPRSVFVGVSTLQNADPLALPPSVVKPFEAR